MSVEDELIETLNGYLRIYQRYRQMIRSVYNGIIVGSLLVMLSFAYACITPQLWTKCWMTGCTIFGIWHVARGIDLLSQVRDERRRIKVQIDRLNELLHVKPSE